MINTIATISLIGLLSATAVVRLAETKDAVVSDLAPVYSLSVSKNVTIAELCGTELDRSLDPISSLEAAGIYSEDEAKVSRNWIADGIDVVLSWNF